MRSLRWRIILLSLLIVFIPIYLLNRYALQFFDLYARTDLENHLAHYAAIMGRLYRAAPDPAAGLPGERYREILSRTAHDIGARIRIVSTNGDVLVDSEAAAAATNLLHRPEIARAVTGRYGARAQLTPDRKFMYYYIARPVTNAAGRTTAVAYVVRHTNPIMKAINEMISNQRLATYLALLAAAAAATVLALTLTRRLRRLRQGARQFAATGRFPPDRIRGRDEIAELDRALRGMADEIDARNQYNRDFVGTTLHELKTPLTAIKGAAEVLRDGAAAQSGPRERFLSNILYQVDRLTQLVGELRELTRADEDNPAAEGQRLDYVEFVRGAVDRLRETFPEPHAPIRLELPDVPLPVVLLPHRLEQVLANLLDNALRHTPPEGSVTVRVTPAGDRVRTDVEDTGCGIEPADQPRVFDRFFTRTRPDRSGEHGSGLGLAIARSILRNHRGTIAVASAPGRGACFAFELPLA